MKKIYLSFLLLLAVFFSYAQNNCATAVAIPSLPYTSGTLTTCGTGDDYEAGTLYDEDYGDGEDYVFSYTAAAPQTLLINVGGADNYKIVSVHSACPPTSGNGIGAVTTGSSTTGSGTVMLPAAGTYYFIVDTWPSPTCAEFTLNISIAPSAPANDVCSGAIVIPSAGPFPYLTGATSNIAATNAGDPTNDCQSNSNKGVWYTFTPSITGEYTLSTCQSVAPLSTIADNVLSVFTSAAGCTGSFTQVVCDDDACSNLGTQAVVTTNLTSGTTYYILVYGYSTSIGDVQLHIAAPVTCFPPTGITAGNISTTSADISFTGTGSFILEYGLFGFTPGTGATAGTGGTVINPATSPQAIGGLSGSNTYQVYIRQNCTGTGGGYSVNSAPLTFSTACGGAADLPYTQNFDGATAPSLPSCTSIENVNGGNTWQTVSNDDDVPHSVPNMLRYDYEPDATTPGNDWFFTAGLNLTSGVTYQLKFWMRNSDGIDYTEKLEIKYGASATAAGMTSAAIFSNTNIDFDEFQEILVNFTVPSTGVYYVGFHEFSDADQAYLCIDDINVDVAPAPLANDECGGALVIGVAPLPATTSNATQTLAANLCSGGTSSAANDAWFQFTTGAGGTAVVTVTGNTVDVVVEAFSGSCGSLTSAGCIDASGTGGETLTLNGLLPSTTYYVRVFGWNGLRGNFNIAVNGAALPVTIEYFRGTKQNNRNVLDWKVSCYNSPTVNLTLERSSDGRLFKDISTTTETAARCLQPFSYNDLSPAAGINYYRLKSIDADGKTTYSNVVALFNKDKGFEIVSLAPNPVKDEATLNVISAERSVIEIVVSDLNGKQVSKQRVSLVAGNNQVPLNLRKMAAGTYQVIGLTADGLSRTLRFVKQ